MQIFESLFSFLRSHDFAAMRAINQLRSNVHVLISPVFLVLRSTIGRASVAQDSSLILIPITTGFRLHVCTPVSRHSTFKMSGNPRYTKISCSALLSQDAHICSPKLLTRDGKARAPQCSQKPIDSVAVELPTRVHQRRPGFASANAAS